MSDINTQRVEILDDCLSQIQTGAAAVADCLNAYPNHRQYLESNLKVALRTHDLLAPPEPREGFKSQAKIRILNQIRAKQVDAPKRPVKKPKKLLEILRPSFAYVTVLFVLVLFASGVGITTASASSLPGDLLYGVKLGIEDTRLAFSQDASSDAELMLQFADRRIEEIEALVESQRIEDLDLALSGYEDLLTQITDLTENKTFDDDGEMLDKIHFGLEHHQEVLERVLEKAPPTAVKGLQNALERSGQGKEKIKRIKEDSNPSDQAPGQQDKEKEKQGGPPDDRGGGNGSDGAPGPPPSKTPKPEDGDGGSDRLPTKTPKPKN